MSSWKLLVCARSQQCLARVTVWIIRKNVQFVPYRNLSYGALNSYSSGTEGEQSTHTRGSWSPHVLGLLGVGLVLCGGRKGKRSLHEIDDVITKFQRIKKPNSR